ncbi:hypothetical protein [Archangium violaceum]|uniref:Fe2OG dioxygenase domain-containing protein n=1 Tax=Archangium violaceum Cb vi76 TaxID=1406225 RepID=A0A084T005_9BACT|nr:hypothetical protein [Archangium violaceum]KFA94040.1 hypothetical protein Q664_05210 [Archangium violaceum Cb vi76]
MTSREDAAAARFARACREDPVLRGWLRPEYLDPRPLREVALARPYVRWAVADHFFREGPLQHLMRRHARLKFTDDDVGLNYHSNAVRVDGKPGEVGLDLLAHPLWHRYAAFVLGAELRMPGTTVVKYRRHPARSRGFWLHTDRDRERPKALAVLAYYNKGWRASDGGLLQLWDVRPLRSAARHQVYRWKAYRGRSLSFLERQTVLRIEAADVEGLVLVEARLVDQIVPAYNRVVFLDFQHTPSFHTVTPSHGRVREGFLQWLY